MPLLAKPFYVTVPGNFSLTGSYRRSDGSRARYAATVSGGIGVRGETSVVLGGTSSPESPYEHPEYQRRYQAASPGQKAQMNLERMREEYALDNGDFPVPSDFIVRESVRIDSNAPVRCVSDEELQAMYFTWQDHHRNVSVLVDAPCGDPDRFPHAVIDRRPLDKLRSPGASTVTERSVYLIDNQLFERLEVVYDRMNALGICYDERRTLWNLLPGAVGQAPDSLSKKISTR